MKVLLTGATGFLGRAIAEELKRNHFELFTTARQKQDSDLPNYVRADIADFNDLEKNISRWRGVECVVHNAGLAHQFKAIDKENFWRANFTGTKNVVEIAAKIKAKKFVLISSVSVYGGNAGKILVSEAFDCQPQGAYAESKLAAEKIAANVCLENDIELKILRLATVYGEEDVGNVLRLLKTIDDRKFFWIGRGENLKSLIYRNDAARAVRLAIEKSGVDKVYNVVGETVSMREIVENLARALAKPVKSVFVPKSLILPTVQAAAAVLPHNKIKAVRNTLTKWLTDDIFDGNSFCQDFDFKPSVALEEGLRREVVWYKTTVKFDA